jgi:tape measure domain-containing protein
MATIDDKVVAMSFESSKFEQGVNKSISALDRLKAALNFPNAGKGLDEINKSAKRVDLNFLARALDTIKDKLKALRLVGIGVLTNIANHAVAAGARFVKAFTIDPVLGGLREYETKLNSVQTILANTQAAGTTLKQVNATLQELNEYSDKTIYNFGQMARNIGTFTAAGVDIKTATGAIKGIANLAALSGSNSEQAATAMYQLSQAISAGRVGLQDWNSVVNAGMGGTVFQRALAQTAEAMGTLKKGSVDLVGPMKNVSINGESFRQSMQAGPGKTSWLSSKVLTTTLKQFTGDLSDAEVKAMGFNDAQVKAIQQTAKTAMHAATEVKTLSQVLSVAKETAESGWAETWQIIFGDFEEAKQTFTGLSNAINELINTNADARNKVLGDWKKLGGRTALIESIKNIFQALGAVLKPIKEAFRDIFPATTGRQLADVTKQFKAFTETLMPSPKTVENLKRTFRGLFALLDIGKQVISGIFTVFSRLFGALDGAGGGFLAITAKIGDWLYAVDQALKKGDRLDKFFEELGAALAKPLEILSEVAGAIADLFGGFSSGGFSGQVNGMTEALTPFQKILVGVSDAWDKFVATITDSGKILRPIFDALIESFTAIVPAIAEAINNMNFEAILAVIRTGLLGGLVLMLRNFFGKGSFLDQIGKGFGGGILANISGSFDALQGSLKAMQTNIKAKTLKEIAIAVALLVLSIVALSFVDPKKLNSAMAAITLAFAQLLGAMAVLEKISTSTGFIKLPLIAAGLIGLAVAIDVLTIAVVALSLLSWEQLLKGLGGVAVLLTGVVAAAGPLSASSAGMIRAGVGITAIAIALNLLALAVRQMGTMSFSEMAQGLGGIAVGLELIVGSMTAMPTAGMARAGAGIILIAVGLNILAQAVKQFGSMNLPTLGKGLGAVGAGLILIAYAMKFMPKNMVVTGAGLVLVALALQGVARAVGQMGGMSIGQLAKGLISLGLALAILGGALHLMSGTIGGAVALGITAASLALLVPVLITLGKQKWTTIVKGLIALVAALVVLGVAAVALSEAIPFMIALGVALTLIGAGLALAGAGVALIGIGLSAVAASGSAAAAVLVQAMITLQKGLVENAKLMILGLLEVVEAFADTAPKFVDAIVKILSSVIDGIIKLSPKIAEAMTVLINTALLVLSQNQDKIIQAGFDLLLALLKGIRNNLPKIVKMVADIIITFINSLSRNLGRIVAAGVNLIINFIKGIAKNYFKIVSAGADIIVNFIKGITNNLSKIATAGLKLITSIVNAIARNISKLVTAGGDVIANFLTGIGNAGTKIVRAGTNAAVKFLNALVSGLLKLANEGAKAMIRFINGVAKAIEDHDQQMRQAGIRLGKAIVNGMIGGLTAMLPDLKNKIEGMASGAVGWFKKKIKGRSPSLVFAEIGKNIVEGLTLGLGNTQDLQTATEAMGNAVIDTTKNIFRITSPSEVMRELGAFVSEGFVNGLRGGEEDINSAFDDLRLKIADGIRSARSEIAAARQTLREENAKAKKERDKGDIAEAHRIIAKNTALLVKLTGAQKALTTARKADQAALTNQSKALQKLNEQLDAAKNIFETYKSQFKELPDIITEDAEGKTISGAEQLKKYVEALGNQGTALNTFKATLDQLKAYGLDDATYEMLLRKGPAAQAFADALVAGGPAAVAEINKLDSTIDTAATNLGNVAAANLYDAGEHTMDGFISGLTSKIAEVEAAITEIINRVVRKVKKKLKIKSPSEIFAEIGRFSAEGMAKGLSDSTGTVVDAVDALAVDAVDAMRKSFSNIPFDDLMDMNPVITPVLDLTAIQTDAAKMKAMVETTPTVGLTSFGQAAVISSEQARLQAEQTAVISGGTSVKFEQNNYSPEALTEIEIYRQTKNQLSLFKSALALT